MVIFISHMSSCCHASNPLTISPPQHPDLLLIAVLCCCELTVHFARCIETNSSTTTQCSPLAAGLGCGAVVARSSSATAAVAQCCCVTVKSCCVIPAPASRIMLGSLWRIWPLCLRSLVTRPVRGCQMLHIETNHTIIRVTVTTLAGNCSVSVWDGLQITMNVGQTVTDISGRVLTLVTCTHVCSVSVVSHNATQLSTHHNSDLSN